MSLSDAIRKSKKYIRPIKSRDDFKEIYLEELISSDELKSYFFERDDKINNDRAKYLYSELTRMVDDYYDKYGKKNFENQSFLRTMVAKPLRKLGVAAATAGHVFMNVYTFPWAYRFCIFPAVGAMAAADVIEGLEYLYHNHEGYDLLQVPKIAAEGLLEKSLAVVPGFVTPLAEATLGNTKFDRAVAGKILYKAKNAFIKKFGEYKAPEKKYLENTRRDSFPSCAIEATTPICIIEVPFQNPALNPA